MVIPVCSLFLQNRFSLQYFARLFSFKLQCSLSEMNGWLRTVSLFKEMTERGKWEHLCFTSHRSGMYSAEFCSSTLQKYTNKHVLFTHRIAGFVQLGREAGREWPDREKLFVLILPLANSPPLDSSSVCRRVVILCWKVQRVVALQPVLQAWSWCVCSMGLPGVTGRIPGLSAYSNRFEKEKVQPQKDFFFFQATTFLNK